MIVAAIPWSSWCWDRRLLDILRSFTTLWPNRNKDEPLLMVARLLLEHISLFDYQSISTGNICLVRDLLLEFHPPTGRLTISNTYFVIHSSPFAFI
jgi:hypothetical protein